jgi:hypothetical protein
MAYVEPQTVCAPKASIRAVEVIYDGGSGEWSVARMNWEDEDRIGIRWNGGDGPWGWQSAIAGKGNLIHRPRATCMV